MNRSFFTAAIVVALASVALRAAPVPVGAKPVPEVHPLKDAKVGDFATYHMTIRMRDDLFPGTMSQTVIARTEKAVTIETAMSINGMPCSSEKYEIDFTKPFDPTLQLSTPEVGTKFERMETGTENLEIAGKEYELVWTSYRITRKKDFREHKQEMKLWRSKSQLGNFVKMEVTQMDNVVNMAMTLELAETGRKK